MKALDFAIKMELDGEQFYLSQAHRNISSGMNTVCVLLSKEEAKHAVLLKGMQARAKDPIISGTTDLQGDTDKLTTDNNVFSGLGDIQMEAKDIPSQLDFYRIALDKEKESIDLYEKALAESEGATDKRIIEFLIKQEKLHYETIEALVDMLRHADEWVESAEFGLRKERY